MADSDAEWVGADIPPWRPQDSKPTPRPRPRPRPTVRPMRPHIPPPSTGHDAADKLPTESGLSNSAVLALSIGGVLGVVLVLLLVYMFVLRKKYNSVKTQKNDAEYQLRIEDAAHVINKMDETCNTYVNTTDLQKLVNTVRAKGKSQERLPVPPRLLKPALSVPLSSDNINNGFTPDEDVTVRPPKPAPSHYKPPLVPPYETVVLNPEYNSKGNYGESNGVYHNVDDKNDSKEPKFLIPFKTMSIEEAQLVATTDSSKLSQSSSIKKSSISPIIRPKVEVPKVEVPKVEVPKVEVPKVPSTSGITSRMSRPAPPPPPNAVPECKPSVPKNSKPTPPTPTNQKPITLAPSTNSRPAVAPPNPPTKPKPSVIVPQISPKPKVPTNSKPSPILPPTHTKPKPVTPPKTNSTSLNSSTQNNISPSLKKGKLPLLPPLKTGILPSLSRDASIDTPETAIEYLTPDCAESSPATASISSKIAFLEGKLKPVNQ